MTERWMPLLAAWLVLAATSAFASEPVPDIDRDTVTVSGISSGGSMAHQLHVAYADRVHGVGIVAGIPWGCAEGRLDLALGRCTGKEQDDLPVAGYLETLRARAKEGRLADASLLADDRAWLFHGRLDTIVPAKVADALAGVYAGLLTEGDVKRVDDVPAAHTFPTLDSGTACGESSSPWLGDCDFDAAGELLSYLYPGLAPPSDADRAATAEEGLRVVPLPGAEAAGLDPEAFLYVPPDCPESGCRLHVALHGCAQAADQVGTAFVDQAGYLPWARANGIVVAFPQTVAQAVNPLACWDWWGYTGPEYLTREGAQLRVLADWIDALVSP